MDFDRSKHHFDALLRLYPRPFRETYGAEMKGVFLASLRMHVERRGFLGLLFTWCRVLADTAWHAARLRLRERRPAAGAGHRLLGGFGRFQRSLREDLRFAARHLVRNRAFTFTAVGTLALGIGLNTAVFGAVYSLLLRPLPGVQDPDGLVQVYRTRGSAAEFLPNSIPLFRDLQADDEVLSGVAAWTFAPMSVAAADQAERIVAQVVSDDFFDVLGVPMIRGRGFSSGSEPGYSEQRVVVVSERFWRSRLAGDPAVIGRTVGINGARWEIVGVASGDFRGPLPVVMPALWAPLSMHPELLRAEDQSENRGNNFLEVVARLWPEVEIERAQEWADRFATRLRESHPEFYDGVGIRLVPQKNAGIHPSFRSAQMGLSGIVMLLVGLLLLVGCVNVAGLFLAKAQSRRGEIAVRRSIGAPRRRLVGQLLMESLLLSFLAGGVGLVLALTAVDMMNRVRVPFDLTLEWNVGLDGPVLIFTLGLTILTSLVFGLSPALQASNPDLVSTLKGGAAVRPGRPDRSRRVLVGGQVAVSTVLLVSAGLFARNLRDALAVDTGFRRDHVLLATVDPGLHGYDREASQRILEALAETTRAIAGVEAVGLARSAPMDPGGAQWLVEVPGYEPRVGESMNIQNNFVGPGYFASMGIPVTEGRSIRVSDGGGDRGVAVVNQSFADRFWPGQSAIGRSFQAGGRGWEVVGVVPTGKYRSLGEEPTPFMYLPWPTAFSSEMTLHVRTLVDPTTIIPVLRREVEAEAADLPLFQVETMEDHLAFALLPARLVAVVVGIFGALCLVLLGVGIHGIVAYSVSRRTREVGIRVAIGAQPRSATRLVLREESRIIISGLIIGLAGALAAGPVVERVLYSGEGLDPAVMVGAPLFLLLVAGVAAYFPARKAALVDPCQALRGE